MTLRSSVIIVFAFFVFAPAVFANGAPQGAPCTFNSDCQSNNCQFTLTQTCGPASTQQQTPTTQSSGNTASCLNAGDPCTSNGTPGTCASTNSGVLYCSVGGASGSSASCTSVGAPCTVNGASGTCQAAFGSLYCSSYSSLQSQPGGANTGNQTQPGGANTGGSGGQSITLINPLGAGTSLPTLLDDILKFVVQIGSIVVILMLVYVGFLFVTARGNEGKITEARRALLWTVVGALILLGAQAIAMGIQATVQALGTGS